MQTTNKKIAGYDTDKKYYWSPVIHWEKKDRELIINTFSYAGAGADVFPEFYYLTQKGVTPAELMEHFSEINSTEFSEFIQDLVKKRVLVSSILTPMEIFGTQNKMFKNEYSEEIIYNPDELKKFKMKQLNRMPVANSGKKVDMKQDVEYPAIIRDRRTYRVFDSTKKISLDVFSQLMSVLKQTRDEDKVTYYYASAGGLYPIDVYVYLKDNRIENMQAGLYYYSPLDNSLILVSNSCVITDEAHFFVNKDIYNSSAFSIFFIYNAEATMPKYGGMAYFYACIDTGLMVGALTCAAELNNIGLCSIGDMNFKKIEKYFKLNENQVLIHTVEGGYKIIYE